MCWTVINEEAQKRSREAMDEQFKHNMEEAKEKQKAREAHEANRCPHCGRNDPLPPWLI